ncbi:MAG TPA: glycosyltransferase family 1 protein [Verrucomicrobiae bacterium]|jgi:glycosyltransferase involved in cell wall biosynthesis|nr:glycosyltransferase family 1 protein [Verrucomicrobiae bacterium]
MGTYVYARNLVAEFSKMDKADTGVEFCLFTCAGNSNDANLVPPSPVLRLSKTAWLRRERFWRLGAASLAAQRERADLFFSPSVSSLPIGRVPVVCTVHDATPVVLPSHAKAATLRTRSLLWTLAKYSRALITVSQCSKNDLVNIYGLPESKVAVVYNGYDKERFNEASPDLELQKRVLRQLGIRKPYILHHGVVQPRKNLGRLIEAYRLMLSANPNLDLELVLAGPLGWRYEEVLAAAGNESAKNGRVVVTDALSDSDMTLLVKGATLAVIPSLYEGFCLPMVEAMACGVPAVAANTSCLQEVSGGVLRYFDPRSVEDMADCMEKVLEGEELRVELAQKGKRQAQRYDWKRCAEDTLEVLKRESRK